MRTPSRAGSFDTFDDHDKLRGQVVLAAGNVSEFSSPQISANDPLQLRKARFYQIAEFCFSFDGNVAIGLNAPFGRDIVGEAALLLVDKFKNASLAEFSASMSQIKVSIKTVALYDCGSVVKKQRADLKQQLDLQLQKNKSLMEMLKRQQQQ